VGCEKKPEKGKAPKPYSTTKKLRGEAKHCLKDLFSREK